MKKMLAVPIMLFSLLVASAFGVTVSIPNTNVNPGTTTVQIPINIDNAAGIAGFQFTVTFDSDVIEAETVIVGSLTRNMTVLPNITTPGQITIAGFGVSELSGGSGSLCIMKFTVIGNPADSTNLNFSTHKLVNLAAQPITHEANGGTFHINGYSISGRVTLSGGTGKVVDVVLTLEEEATKATTKPNAQGNYSFTDLPRGTYTITPQLSGYVFNPVNRQVVITNANIAGQNFTGSALASVSGTISYSGTQSGKINIGLFTSSDFTGQPAYGTQITGAGAYTITDIAPATYYAAAYMDASGDNQWQQTTEPSGAYSGNPFTLTAGQQKTGVNITLKEPLTLTVASAHGSPNPTVGAHAYYTGDSITASVVSPVAGATGIRYVCTGWTGTGSVPAAGTTTTTTFTINQNSTITWNWKTQYLLTYSADPAAGGDVTVNPTATGNWYDENVSVTLTQTPKTGYVFLHWIVDGVENTTEPLIITMDASHTIVAKYALNQPVLEVKPTSVQLYFNIKVDQATKETDIIIKNTGSGAGTLNWQINPANIVYQQGTNWIEIQQPDKNSVITGSLSAGEQQKLILKVDRTDLLLGEYNATIPVTSNGGNTEIKVKMIINQPPVAEALKPSEEIEVETAVEFEAQFTNTRGIARSEWNIYHTAPGKALPPPLKTIRLQGAVNKIILPFSMFAQGEEYYWSVQCWDSYGEASEIDGENFSVRTKDDLAITIIDATQSETLYLPEAATVETAVFVSFASEQGRVIIRPLNVADFPGAASVFTNLFDIRVEGINDGDTSVIVFEVPGSVSSWVKYIYDNETGKWTVVLLPSDITADNYAVCSPSQARAGYTTVELKLKDGGDYDFDGTENGIISDPSGSVTESGGITKVSGGGGGCFIATAAFGSYQEKHVWILRQFRDKYLLTNPVGAAFVRWYYRHSPKYAAIIAQNETLRTITRAVLMPVYGIAYITLKIGMLFWIFVVAGILSIVATKKGGKWLKRVF